MVTSNFQYHIYIFVVKKITDTIQQSIFPFLLIIINISLYNIQEINVLIWHFLQMWWISSKNVSDASVFFFKNSNCLASPSCQTCLKITASNFRNHIFILGGACDLCNNVGIVVTWQPIINRLLWWSCYLYLPEL